MANCAVFIECNTCLFYNPSAPIVLCSVTYGEFPITCPLNLNHPKYRDLCKEVVYHDHIL